MHRGVERVGGNMLTSGRQKMQVRITKSKGEKDAQAPAGVLEEREKVIAVQGEASPSSSLVHVTLPSDGVGKAP